MLDALHDRTTWNTTSHGSQLDIIEHVSDVLGDAFEFNELSTFRCGKHKNTVAAFLHKPTNLKMHLLPGDTFQLGSGQYNDRIQSKYMVDLPEYYDETVTVRPFLIGQYLITEAAWAAFDGADLFRTFGATHPVDAIDRHHAAEWAKRAGLRLPSEVEWEYACKAGSTSIFYWGNTPKLSMAWTSENTDYGEDYRTFTADEQKPPNAFGLLGMIGNLGEWVADDAYSYGVDHDPQQIPHSQDPNADGILRGGWNEYDWKFNRSTSRIECGAGDTGCSARIAFSLEL